MNTPTRLCDGWRRSGWRELSKVVCFRAARTNRLIALIVAGFDMASQTRAVRTREKSARDDASGSVVALNLSFELREQLHGLRIVPIAGEQILKLAIGAGT